MIIIDTYRGLAKDQSISKDSRFYDLVEPRDDIMVDTGFQMIESILFQNYSLPVPPWARIKTQNKKAKFKKVKEISSFRMFVELTMNEVELFHIS